MLAKDEVALGWCGFWWCGAGFGGCYLRFAGFYFLVDDGSEDFFLEIPALLVVDEVEIVEKDAVHGVVSGEWRIESGELDLMMELEFAFRGVDARYKNRNELIVFIQGRINQLFIRMQLCQVNDS